jgi:hypothetical protein
VIIAAAVTTVVAAAVAVVQNTGNHPFSFSLIWVASAAPAWFHSALVCVYVGNFFLCMRELQRGRAGLHTTEKNTEQFVR